MRKGFDGRGGKTLRFGIVLAPNDQVERRAVAPTTNEADLFQSSIPLHGSTEMILPRSLEPIVRCRADKTGTQSEHRRQLAPPDYHHTNDRPCPCEGPKSNSGRLRRAQNSSP